MNKEEILAKAQKENKGKDEADIEWQKKGAYAAYFIGVIGILLVSFITYWVKGIFNFGPIAIIFLMAFVGFSVKYVNSRKKHELMVALLYGINTLGFLALWILQLCEVI